MGQSYKTNMRAAAFRHLEAGEHLKSTKRKDVAGYLFGLAAECALKHMMRASGMRPLPDSERRRDPFFAHFEELKTLLRDAAGGRLATELRRYAESSSFLQHWDVSMRYSDGRTVREVWIERWHKNAKDIVSAIDG